MDHFRLLYSFSGNAINRELEEEVERIFSDFGYQRWTAIHDPKTGLRELAFGKIKSKGQLRSSGYPDAERS